MVITNFFSFHIILTWFSVNLLPLAVKIIMDKISKRSKGYAFIEYTTEEAAATALEEMNGKVALQA